MPVTERVVSRARKAVDDSAWPVDGDEGDPASLFIYTGDHHPWLNRLTDWALAGNGSESNTKAPAASDLTI